MNKLSPGITETDKCSRSTAEKGVIAATCPSGFFVPTAACRECLLLTVPAPERPRFSRWPL
jgi:hypothetical protein